MAPLVSIAVPFHDTARFLPAALDSLLAQDHPHWECLLWDDGSADGSGTIAAAYASRDARFRVLGDGRNHGVGAASAGALALARGDYVGVLDADDLLEPAALSAMVAFLAGHPELGMAYSQYVEIDEDGALLGTGTRFRTPYAPQRLLLEFMTYHFRLMRADAYRAIGGFDPAMRVSADYDLCLRMSERYRIAHLPQVLYRYRIRRASISQANRLRQVRASYEAAQRAVQRRGLDRDHAFSLGLRARHVLRPKAAGGDA
jgi:glycosyltransferase involved in cell wall biosynthesis